MKADVRMQLLLFGLQREAWSEECRRLIGAAYLWRLLLLDDTEEKAGQGSAHDLKVNVFNQLCSNEEWCVFGWLDIQDFAVFKGHD